MDKSKLKFFAKYLFRRFFKNVIFLKEKADHVSTKMDILFCELPYILGGKKKRVEFRVFFLKLVATEGERIRPHLPFNPQLVGKRKDEFMPFPTRKPPI